jgi:hypothetical protein
MSIRKQIPTRAYCPIPTRKLTTLASRDEYIQPLKQD